MHASPCRSALLGCLLATTLLGGCGESAETEAQDATPKTTTTVATTGGEGQASILPSGSIPLRTGAAVVYGEPAAVDFGVVPPGSKMEANITLVNPTNRPMRILRAEPTCQCTTVEIQGLVIPTKGGIRFPITLQVPNTSGLKQAAVNTLLVPDVEGSQPIQGPRLTLKAVAAYPVRTSPVYIDALTQAGMTGEVTLNSVDQRPFRVLSVNGEPPRVAGSNQPAITQVVGYDLRGKTPTTMPKWLFIETDHPEAPIVDLRIRHEWSKLPHQTRQVSVVFDGYLANVGAIRPGVPAPFTIELKQAKNRRVVGLDSENPAFKINLIRQVDGDGDRIRIDASVTPGPDAKGPFVIPISCRTLRGAETMYLVGTVR